MDAHDHMQALNAQIRAILTQAGHSACRFNPEAWYDPSAPAINCGCGKTFPLEERLTMPGNPAPSTEVAPRPDNLPVAADPIQATLALIDPTQQYTPVDLEKRLLDVLARLEVGALAERAAVDEYYQAKSDYDLKYARAVVASQMGAADTRKADAMVQCAEEYLRLNVAEHAMKALKETMHNLRGILSGYQSVTRSVGLDYQAGGANR